MELQRQAEALPINQRRKIIMDYPETDLYQPLKELFQAMEPKYTVEITHGAQEFGKDLVIVKTDKFTKEVIGVVVKCGDIRGTTRGHVDDLKLHTKTMLSKRETVLSEGESVLSEGDKKKLEEIRSQTEQALAHPAEIKSILEDLPISKVYIVLNGEFSNNARKRLKKELKTEIEIFDINWLINKFTEFYPQIFFEGRIIDFLEEKTRELEENHRLRKSGKNLSEYFINPLIMPLSAPLEFDENSLKTVFKERKLPFFRLLDISKKKRKLILLGDPGTGKTGAMVKLAIDMYQNASSQLLKKTGKSNKKIPVPVLVPARKFLTSESVGVFLSEYFKSEETKSRFKVDVITT